MRAPLHIRRRLLGRHRYGLVLLAVLCSFVYQSAVPDSGLARAGAILIQCATLLLAVWAAGGTHVVARAAELLAAGLAAATVVLAAVAEIPPAGERLANGLLVGLAPMIIGAGLLRSLRADGRVNVRHVSGVLSIFILIGLFFSFVFGAVSRLDPAGFFAGHVTGQQAKFVYFSFSTLTTTGFGDFTAGTDLGRTLAVCEALIGQVYLVTVVALIVSNLRPRREPTQA